MKIIDGSYGEGGGQIFRTSLTLAMCLGETVRIENIRAGRKKPGLLRQHLACLRAAQEICGAQVDGDYMGSQEVMFAPGRIKGGDYEFSVGSAGSTTLIFQTIFLPLLMADERTTLTLSGGTHNGMAPSYEFLTKSFLPIMRRMGCDIKTHLECYGFYPAGGGKWQVAIQPNNGLQYLVLAYSDEARILKAVAISSKVPQHVAEREIGQVALTYELNKDEMEIRNVNSVGPGNILSLQLSQGGLTNVFDAFGQKNVSAESVANKAIRMLQQFEQANVAVDEHLADQLLLPLICAKGGVFTTSEPSQHLLTNSFVVEKFVGKRVSINKENDKAWRVEVKSEVNSSG
ncbi:MAG: RNA 3'-terminal phosphate cyclase (ATP) [Flavobacteriales bacterium]|jgi:RNA 3'-terminal phosphate cyclase (ATP)